LLELALVWELLNKGLLRRAAPLVLLGDHWARLPELIRREQPDTLEPVLATSVAEVIEHVRRARGAAHDSDGGPTASGSLASPPVP
jgi:hypothetical protein